MQFEFEDEKLDRLHTDPNFYAGYPPALVSSFRKRIQAIDAAQDERIFYNLRSLRFEKLQGARSGQYSMRLNDQWRLILRFKQQGGKKIVMVMGIEDYH